MFDKKKLVINCDICDARAMDENAYAKYEQIIINADMLLVTERTRALFAALPITCNVDETIDIPEGEMINTVSINGDYEVGPNTRVSKNTILNVNGNVHILPGAGENIKNFLKISVNGDIKCPKSLEDFMDQASVNGSVQIYPDDCVILDSRFVMDKYFPFRAKENGRYYAEEKVILGNVDLMPLVEKNVLFITPMVVAEEAQLMKAVSLFEESAEFVEVPEGCTVVEGDIDLNLASLKQFGVRLFVDGNLTLMDDQIEPLEKLEKLVVKGTIFASKKAAELLNTMDAIFEEIKIEKGRKIVNKIKVTLDETMFLYSPDGIMVANAASVKIAEQVSPADILEKLELANCASVKCSEEQRSAVELVSSNVASISCGKDDGEGSMMSGIMGALGGAGDIIGMLKDAKLVNADKHVM